MDGAVQSEFHFRRFPVSRYQVHLVEALEFLAGIRPFHSSILAEAVPALRLVKTPSTCRCLRRSPTRAEERHGFCQETGPRIAEAKFKTFLTRSQLSCAISTASDTTH